MSALVDISGRQFGKWVALRREGSNGKYALWRVRCECGAEALVRGDSLRGGGSTGCVRCAQLARGVANRTHGLTKTPTWISWLAMRTRCENPNAADYPNYGAKGVTVCERWGDFVAFLADMGERPSRKHSLDRIDPTGNYEPSNCRWATHKTQQRNRRKTVWITFDGRRQSLSDWADELGIGHITLYKRYAAGWTHAEIVGEPVRPRGSKHLHRRRYKATEARA